MLYLPYVFGNILLATLISEVSIYFLSYYKNGIFYAVIRQYHKNQKYLENGLTNENDLCDVQSNSNFLF